MSIAKREAEKLPILANIYKKADLHNNTITFKGANDVAEDAYVAGRTSEPTKAEIEAVAKVIAKIIFALAPASTGALDVGTYVYDWNFYIDNAKSVLMAARKVVAE